MTVFNWIIAFIVIQTVVALLFLVWSYLSGQMKDVENQGRRVFFDDLEQDRLRPDPAEPKTS